MIQKNTKLIHVFYSDTMDPETIRMLSDYHTINRVFKQFIEKKTGLNNKIEYSIKQLDALKQDLIHERISTAQFSTYIAEESKAVNNTCNSINILAEDIGKGTKNFDHIQPIIDKLIAKLDIPDIGKITEVNSVDEGNDKE
jgi:hypothetical protein